MLMPKRVKHRKEQKGRIRGKATRGSTLVFGEFGLMALESTWITDRQIEASRIAITRHVRRGGKVWIRLFPAKPVTIKPAETRMGKGKGSPDHWVCPVKRGRILFELGLVDRDIAQRAMVLAGHKFPIKTKVVERKDV